MTIRKKITGGLCVIFAIGLILGICGLVSTNMLTKLSDEQYELQKSVTGVSSVLNAHYIWRQGLTETVLSGKDFTGSLDPNTCSLGKWKNSKEAQSITDAEILNLLQSINEPHTFIHHEAESILKMIDVGDFEGAKRELTENVLPRTGDVIAILTAMQERYTVLLDEKGTEIVSTGRFMTITIISTITIATIISVLLAIVIINSIMKPVQSITKAAQTIATGDLDVNINYSVNDEIGRLAASLQNLIDDTKKQVFVAEALADGDLTVKIETRGEKDAMNLALKRMVEKLNEMFGQIMSGTNQVSTGAKQIADGAQTLAQGATEQAATVQQLSAAISEVSGKTKDNSLMADKASSLADIIKNNAEKGSKQMNRMTQAVKDINEASQSISKVIKTIDDIAFQTNILALNAAVEAARAGQHGKGFAVVADEVRNLAAKSAEAAKDTGALIVNAMEKAELGERIADETAESLDEIVSGIGESGRIIKAISKASEEQSVSISEINKSIDQVAQVVQQNSATAQQSAAASEEMSSQSNLLQGFVSQFRIKGVSNAANISSN